jgi:prevent-host-death family protein
MKIVSVLEAKNQLSKLIRAVRAGDDIIIANRGTPVARLTGVDSDIAGSSRGTATAILQQIRVAPRHRSSRQVDQTIAR